MKPYHTARKATLAALVLALALATPTVAQTLAPAPTQPVTQAAPPGTVSQTDQQHLKEKMIDGLAHQESLNQERISTIKSLIEAQNSRISDLQAFVGWVIGVLGLVLPIAMVVVSRATYVSAKSEAGDNAAKAAEAWMDAHAPQRLEELEARYRDQIEERLGEAERKINDVHSRICEKEASINDIEHRLMEKIGSDQKGPLSGQEKDDLEEVMENVRSTPKNMWQFHEWNMFALEKHYSGDNVEASKAFQKAVDAKDAKPVHQARALYNKGVVLGKAGRTKEELATYDVVEARFGSSDELAMRELVAKALINKGVALNKEGRLDEALVAYEAVEARFGGAEELVLREWVAKALISKGVIWGTTGRTDEALAAYEAVKARFGKSQELALRKLVANALINKGVELRKAGRTVEALATHDEVEQRFGESDEPVLREQVASARSNRAFVRLTQAKEAWLTPEGNEKAKALLTMALENVEDALALQPDGFISLGNKGYALFLLGRDAEAEAPLRRALELGGDVAYKNELDDAQIHSLPQDKDFIALVERLWAEVQAAKNEGEEGGGGA